MSLRTNWLRINDSCQTIGRKKGGKIKGEMKKMGGKNKKKNFHYDAF